MNSFIACTYCQLKFINVSACQKHINQKHGHFKKCPKCNKGQSGLYMDFVRYHIQRIHKYSCKRCNLSFIRKRGLLRHKVKCYFV